MLPEQKCSVEGANGNRIAYLLSLVGHLGIRMPSDRNDVWHVFSTAVFLHIADGARHVNKGSCVTVCPLAATLMAWYRVGMEQLNASKPELDAIEMIARLLVEHAEDQLVDH